MDSASAPAPLAVDESASANTPQLGAAAARWLAANAASASSAPSSDDAISSPLAHSPSSKQRQPDSPTLAKRRIAPPTRSRSLSVTTRAQKLADPAAAATRPLPYAATPVAPSAVRNGLLTTTLKRGADPTELQLQVQSLAAGAVRVHINEQGAGAAKRFKADAALSGDLTLRGFVAVQASADNSAIVLTLDDDGTTATLRYSPFCFTVANKAGVVLAELNERGLLNWEPYRAGVRGENEEPGLWDESFKTHSDSKPNGPMAVAADISFPAASHVYGIPEHASSLALKRTHGPNAPYSNPYRLYNLDVFEYELDEPMALYGSIPFMLAHSASAGTTGVFWLNAAETWVDISARDKQGTSTHWISESGIIDVFIFPGPRAEHVMRAYSTLTGFAPLPPMFSLGYHQCKWNYRDEADVLAVDTDFDKHALPYDVIWLDIEHTDGKKYTTWDPRHFPTPDKMQHALEQKRRWLVTIVDPHLKREAGYELHKEAEAQGLYIKKAGGKDDYEGWCWPGSSGYPDFTSDRVRAWWGSRLALDKYKGSTRVLHVWNDMNEPSVFNGPEVTMHKDAVHVGGFEHREVHNLYGFFVHQATYAGLKARDADKQRPFVLSRAFFAGSQRHGAIWTGDNKADWSHLKAATPMLLSINLAGLSFAGADVGGFFGNPDVELLTRFYQAGSFFPFFRAHAHLDSKRREPYLFGERTTDIMRQILRNRYALLPYYYTLFRNHSVSGTPVMRPLWFEFDDDEATFAMEQAFMVGPALLVHPIVAPGVKSERVYLPIGASKWYDYFSGAEQTRNGWLDVAVVDEHCPVYLRGGSIIPKKLRPRRNSAAMAQDPYTLVVAPDQKGNAQGSLYVDDELSFQYLSGKHLDVSCRFEAHKRLTCAPAFGNFKDVPPVERVIIHGVAAAPKSVRLQPAQRSLEFEYDSKTKTLTVRKPDAQLAGPQWSLEFLS